jgi:NADH dehydrogenase FAD-containing subunit
MATAVIVGGGFGCLAAAKALRKAPARVLLIAPDAIYK